MRINKAITAPIKYPKVVLTSTGLDVFIKIVAFIIVSFYNDTKMQRILYGYCKDDPLGYKDFIKKNPLFVLLRKRKQIRDAES